MAQIKQHQQRWFTNRVGKRIYRLTPANCCKECDEIERDGLVVHNKDHAYWLYVHQNELRYKYADKKGQ